MITTEAAFADLIHEVNSRGSNLKEAAALLPKATEAERRELLSLMATSAKQLADYLETFRGEAES